jgi:hypothetical protein
MLKNSQTGKGNHAQRKNSINDVGHKKLAHTDEQEGKASEILP